jgi:hypothetical protein
LTLASSTARSGLPGAYCLIGSLTGGGTLVTASMATRSLRYRVPDSRLDGGGIIVA